jgi:hypothetical protein
MASQTTGWVGRDAGPVARALALGCAVLGAAVPTKRATITVPRAMRTCLVWAAQ